MYFKIWQKTCHCTIETLMTRKCLFKAKNKTNACIGLSKWGEGGVGGGGGGGNLKRKKNSKIERRIYKISIMDRTPNYAVHFRSQPRSKQAKELGQMQAQGLTRASSRYVEGIERNEINTHTKKKL